MTWRNSERTIDVYRDTLRVRAGASHRIDIDERIDADSGNENTASVPSALFAVRIAGKRHEPVVLMVAAGNELVLVTTGRF